MNAKVYENENEQVMNVTDENKLVIYICQCCTDIGCTCKVICSDNDVPPAHCPYGDDFAPDFKLYE